LIDIMIKTENFKILGRLIPDKTTSENNYYTPICNKFT